MTNQQLIGQHSDSGFVQGFERYFVIDEILKSGSWNDLKQGLNRRAAIMKQPDEWESRLFQEFRFYNLVKKVEQNSADLLFTYLIKGNFINVTFEEVFDDLMEQVKRYRRGGAVEEAEKAITDRLGDLSDSKKRLECLLNPDVMFYIVGLSLGGCINRINNYTNPFPSKTELLSLLRDFYTIRNKVFHNGMSSRIVLADEIQHGMNLGQEILKLIEELYGSQFEPVISSQVL